MGQIVILLNQIDGPYSYGMIGRAIIPGSLSHLLCIADGQLMTMYQSCGFYSLNTNCLSDTIFQGFIESLNILMDITRYSNKNPKNEDKLPSS
jgi:hypothetical protein